MRFVYHETVKQERIAELKAGSYLASGNRFKDNKNTYSEEFYKVEDGEIYIVGVFRDSRGTRYTLEHSKFDQKKPSVLLSSVFEGDWRYITKEEYVEKLKEVYKFLDQKV